MPSAAIFLLVDINRSELQDKTNQMPYTEMSYTINLTDEQFAILQNLVNEGMETILSPYDNINLNEDQEEQISKILSVVTFFNSHNILK